jgi:transcriptional regulator of acetoin/glycerol metabolism
MAMRQHGFLLIGQGRLAEARQRLEATVATFGVVGDVIQTFVARIILARIAVAGGAPDAEAQEARVHEELARHHATIAPELYRFTVGIVAPPSSERLREPSLTERLVVAVERLSVPGFQPDLIPRELGSILRAVFPGREVLALGSSIVAGEGEMADFGAGGRFGVRGALDAEHRAALRLLSMVALRITDDGASVTEEEVAVDTVLPGFVAAAPATRRLKAEVAQLSRSSATILIDGESGSGKEVVARAVHDLSMRSQRPYVVFNCASIPRDLFESQLFGHRRGSFTGAAGDNLGVVRAADGGTLFLDEIGELPLEMQPKLLRFLENGEVLPIGETKARRVDVRVIAATHRDLVALVREGRFREDLFYRLNVVPLRVPPLRDRKEDVLALARLFISRLVPEGTDPPHLGADAVTALMAHRWPGNVRELRNLVERAMAYAPIPRVLHARDLRIDERSS